MTIRNKLGNLTIWFISLLTIVIWFIVRQGTPMFLDYDISTHSLGQITGLVGMTLFALTFVLTTRLKFVEDSFGGLDKMYKTHHFIGALAFVLLLFHPLLLVLKFIPSNILQAAVYLWPSGSWAVNFGIVSLLSMILLIVLTLYVNMKYQNWKFSHKWMGLVYLLALFHIFLVTTDISRYFILKEYMVIISAIGASSYLYGSFLRDYLNPPLPYLVSAISERGNITLIELSPQDKKLIFRPGQFVFLKIIDDNLTKEKHPFTIASSPLNDKLLFAIKDLGDYTSSIKNIKKGSKIEIEGPYGRFGISDSNKKQVWIAGGIGITPFLGIIDQIRRTKQKISKIDLYYCVNNEGEAVFLKEINEQAKSIPNLRIIPWFSSVQGRIDSNQIEKRSPLSDTQFFICGPSEMMHSLSDKLIEKGVKKSDIRMEDFNLK